MEELKMKVDKLSLQPNDMVIFSFNMEEAKKIGLDNTIEWFNEATKSLKKGQSVMMIPDVLSVKKEKIYDVESCIDYLDRLKKQFEELLEEGS